jgi:hypothetical protein
MKKRTMLTSLAFALDNWSLNNVSNVIDCASDDWRDYRGKSMSRCAIRKAIRAAQLDCNMMRRLTRIAQAVVDKAKHGELTTEEAIRLNCSDEDD